MRAGGVISEKATLTILVGTAHVLSNTMRPTFADYLTQHIRKTALGCLEWTGCYYASGYPKFKGRSFPGGVFYTRVNRAVLAFKLGRDLQPGELALHTCDNLACANPEHLYVGSIAENNRDTVARSRRGIRKLSPQDQQEIRRLYQTGLFSQTELSQDFNVSQVRVSQITNLL